jgi:UDP-xylose/UDP-N-acetylglucosamine transporter B4
VVCQTPAPRLPPRTQLTLHTGLLITFFQFAFIAAISLPVPLLTGSNQNNGKGSVPMARWAYIAFLFYSINMLNNWAFAFNISVPVHIILRSFGSVTTMLAGVVRGKRYSKLQVSSVVILTVGVLVSAWADSMSKVCPDSEVRRILSHFIDDRTTTGQIDESRVVGFEH